MSHISVFSMMSFAIVKMSHYFQVVFHKKSSVVLELDLDGDEIRISSGTSSFFSRHKTKTEKKRWKYFIWCEVNSKVEAYLHPFIIHTRLAFYFLNAYVNKINLSVRRHSSTSYGSRLRVLLYKRGIKSHAIQLIKQKSKSTQHQSCRW